MSDQDRCETAVKLALALVEASRPVALSPETIARATLDYYRAGCEIVYTCDECCRQVKGSESILADGRLCPYCALPDAVQHLPGALPG